MLKLQKEGLETVNTHTRKMQCSGCVHSDIYNTYEYRAWGQDRNITNVWCKKLFKNVRHPYEKCRYRIDRKTMILGEK